jgi:Ca2+-binding EF-hand superfamily protein
MMACKMKDTDGEKKIVEPYKVFDKDRNGFMFKDGSRLELVFEDGLTLGSELGIDEGFDDVIKEGLTLGSEVRL